MERNEEVVLSVTEDDRKSALVGLDECNVDTVSSLPEITLEIH